MNITKILLKHFFVKFPFLTFLFIGTNFEPHLFSDSYFKKKLTKQK